MNKRIVELANSHKVIALMLPCLLTGGTEVATLETAQAFQVLGYAVEIVVYFDEVDAAMLEAFRASGLFVHILGVKRGAGMRSQWQLATGILGVLLRKRYSIIWLQYMTPTLLPLALSRLFTHNLIAAVHVAALHYSPSGLRRLRWLARYWCAKFVCVSHTVATGIFGPEGTPDRATDRVLVLPNALDMSVMKAAPVRNWRVEAGWPEDVVVVGFAGRLAHIKGADLLLYAVAHLSGQGLPVRLVVVGEGAEEERLKALSKALGIGSITLFAGRVSRREIYSAIKGFDIAAVPSREEGFGLSALEAMAAGVPVVASRVDALQEVVLEGVTGLLCPVGNPESFADSLARLVDDPLLRKSMGTAGVAHVASMYDTPAYRAQLADLVMGLLADS